MHSRRKWTCNGESCKPSNINFRPRKTFQLWRLTAVNEGRRRSRFSTLGHPALIPGTVKVSRICIAILLLPLLVRIISGYGVNHNGNATIYYHISRLDFSVHKILINSQKSPYFINSIFEDYLWLFFFRNV